jgi:pyruvate dehydrogenase E1 component
VSVDYRTERGADADIQEWLEALDSIIEAEGPRAAKELLQRLQQYAWFRGVRLDFRSTTPYVNTIPVEEEPEYPEEGADLRRITKSLIRWNAMAMVVRANRGSEGIGGHISTYASAATLYETGFNFFFRGKSEDYGGDQIYFQGHAAPGIYARAFLEGRITLEQMENFRAELQRGGGLSSYPHPWLMPDFWQFPTVSMGLGPIMAIYQARFMRYLENRGLKPRNGGKVWAFLGDGECDEPESLGAIGMAVREKLDNLIFVINCNLQRLDGPVRGNGKIIQELEGIFRGAGWNVIKVLWGSDWDRLFAQDKENVLESVFSQIPDGEFQKFTVATPEYIRQRLIERDPRVKFFLDQLSDSEIKKIKRGGHDPRKIYAAYDRAVKTEGAPTLILAKTVKGYGLGESGEGKNITHQQKKLNEEELREFRGRFGVPISDDDIAFAPFYRPADDSPAITYLREQRAKLGGYLPRREVNVPPVKAPDDKLFSKIYEGSDRPASTTMAFVQILRALLQDKELGKLVVPIVPDEARTFGMDGLFKQVGIYNSQGQKYEPVDASSLMYYREAVDGQLLEEGINEAGAMSSFIAAGTAYATHGIPTIPFFIFYSMFGMQRIGDLVWAAGDSRCRGFLIGGTAGRTTLNGEGLQHQDGHSHVLGSTVPNLICYDVAYAYELAVIIRDGIRRMYEDQEDIFYYLTVHNENYPMPAMPDNKRVREGILKGMYKFRPSTVKGARLRAQLLGSGAILNEVLKAQEMLAEYGVGADVWAVTSYNELRREGLDCDRWNLLHPGSPAKQPYVAKCLKDEPGVVVASSDYMKIQPDGIAKWVPQGIVSLGTDGYGRSESREALRDFFEVDARFVTIATLNALCKRGEIGADVVKKAMKHLKISGNKLNPMRS